VRAFECGERSVVRLKILFNDRADIELGSTRIWVHNLQHWLAQLGYDVHLNDWDHYSDYDIIIFGKSMGAEEILRAKTENPQLLCGIINPSDYTQAKKCVMDICDFFVVGSIEERDYYYRYNDNVILFPLIERIFNKVKVHDDHEPILLGYHGNLHHLTQFHPHLKEALEKLDEEFPIRLLVVSNEEGARSWRIGRPDVDIEIVQWGLDVVQEQLLRCDIGLVPGLTPISQTEKNAVFKFLKQSQSDIISYHYDYLLRFKNNSNAGRAFVFFQLGIPVVSDFIPSCFHILATPDCGFLAHNTDGYLHALRTLCRSAETREKIAQNALKTFQHYYNPLDWSMRVYNDLEKLWEIKREGFLGGL